MVDIQITVRSGGTQVDPDEVNQHRVSADQQVTLKVTTDPPGTAITQLVWKRDGRTLPADAGYVATERLAEGAAELTFQAGAQTVGTYEATATIAGADATASVAVAAAETDRSGADGKPIVTEVHVGELDRTFTYGGGAVVAAGLVALGIAFARLITSIPLPAAPLVLAPESGLDGGFGQRVAAMVQLTAAYAGLTLLIAGAFLAALEVRGRLRAANVREPADADARGGLGAVPAEALEKFRDLVKELSTTRGTVIVLVAGTFVLALALWSSTSLASPTLPQPSAGASSAASKAPAVGPSDGPSHAPSDAPSRAPSP